MSSVSSGSFRQSDKRKGTNTCTLPVGKGMETEPLLVNDGSPFAGERKHGYQSISLVAPDSDPLRSARPVQQGGPGGWKPDDDLSKGMDREVTMVCLAAGWVMFLEGINGMAGLAISYFFKNTLHVEPATLSSISSITALPWTCKPLYGFISDGFPLFGYRRKPYLFIAGIFGSVSWFLMAKYVTTVVTAAVCMTIGSAAIAVANVIAEALVVERSRGESQEYASRLQSIIYAGQAVGGILAAWAGGYLLTFMSDQQVFLLVASFPLSLIVIAAIVPEQRFYGDQLAERSKIGERLRGLWNAFKQPEIWRPCAFIFFLNATPATGATWFYFYTDVLKFSSSFLGTIGVVGSCCTLLGVFVFDLTLKQAAFRPVFLWSTLISTGLGLTQLLLVFRWNEALGIPDAVFCLGESAVLSIIGWICTMPVLVLAARLCPEGMEGTMYALIMSINNLGGIVGSQLGAMLTTYLGVTEKNLDNFWLLVLLCNLSTVVPLVFIGFVPEIDPGKDQGKEKESSDEQYASGPV